VRGGEEANQEREIYIIIYTYAPPSPKIIYIHTDIHIHTKIQTAHGKRMKSREMNKKVAGPAASRGMREKERKKKTRKNTDGGTHIRTCVCVCVCLSVSVCVSVFIVDTFTYIQSYTRSGSYIGRKGEERDRGEEQEKKTRKTKHRRDEDLIETVDQEKKKKEMNDHIHNTNTRTHRMGGWLVCFLPGRLLSSFFLLCLCLFSLLF
jgi:hypothetical protein